MQEIAGKTGGRRRTLLLGGFAVMASLLANVAFAE